MMNCKQHKNDTAKCSVVMIYFRRKIILNTDKINLHIPSLGSTKNLNPSHVCRLIIYFNVLNPDLLTL